MSIKNCSIHHNGSDSHPFVIPRPSDSYFSDIKLEISMSFCAAILSRSSVSQLITSIWPRRGPLRSPNFDNFLPFSPLRWSGVEWSAEKGSGRTEDKREKGNFQSSSGSIRLVTCPSDFLSIFFNLQNINLFIMMEREREKNPRRCMTHEKNL
jgi:hypothetical protein